MNPEGNFPKFLQASGEQSAEASGPASPGLIAQLERFSRLAGQLLILAGGTVLFGWLIDNQVLMRVLPSLVSMNPLSAVCFVMAGLILALCGPAGGNSSPWQRRCGNGLASVLIAVGTLKLLDCGLGWDLGIDQLLFRRKLALDSVALSNRMAPNTAVNFVLSGTVLLLLNRREGAKSKMAQNLSLIVGFQALLALLGYIYSANYLYGVGSFIPMALHTAVLFLLLAAALLFKQADYGAVALFLGQTPGGITARRLLPLAFAVPAVLGGVRLWGEKRHLYNSEVGVTVMVLACMCASGALIWWNALLLNRADKQRSAAEAGVPESP